ncbi:MAG: hypothetical protein IPJ14_16405 [Kineosporiaceae bacterium]|nr:hypothetical protein [Kineosporiaceae bacterium]MBK7624192.1 hypothetical protein [Kineosporiaceae bacterium]MBK8075334.1 hypothetical protein [Kineosporiaceae bacterium]
MHATLMRSRCGRGRRERRIDRHRATICPATGKQRYRDHRQAADALRSRRRARQLALALGLDSARREIRVYRCPWCNGGWHTTSQPPVTAPR